MIDLAFRRYSALDSAVLMDIYDPLFHELDSLRDRDTYDRHIKLIEPLVYMSTRGIRMDVEGLKEESKVTGERVDQLRADIYDESEGHIDNPNSVPQLKTYFYVEKGIKPYIKRGSGGAITTDGDALKRLNRRGYKVAGMVLELRKLVKLKSTYLDVKLDKDNRLRCSWNPVGAKSGRLSSSKTIFGTGMNMQNQPHSMLKYQLADEGYIMYDIDLSQADNRVMAYISGEKNMIDAFDNGEDIHRKTASLIFRKPPDEISEVDGSSSIGTGMFSERFWGKKANHSLNYDMGYKSFAFTLEIPESDAKFIVSAYHAAYPGIRQFYEWVQTQLRNSWTLTNACGRRRKFFGRWGHELFKEAYSFIPQSTVADKINQDGVIYTYYNQDLFQPVEILNQVHDSMAIQIPLKTPWKQHAFMLNKIKQSLEQKITWRIREFFLPADLKMGLNMKDTEKIMLRDNPSDSLLTDRLEKAYGTITK